MLSRIQYGLRRGRLEFPDEPRSGDPAHRGQPDVRLSDIADAFAITERTAYRIVVDLTEAGYVVKEHDGRRNHYHIQDHLPLRDATTAQAPSATSSTSSSMNAPGLTIRHRVGGFCRVILRLGARRSGAPHRSGGLRLEVGGEVGQGRGESFGVVLGRDAVRYVVGGDADYGFRQPTSCTSQVMVMVPAKSGSSETKSTAWTTRSPSTMSTKRASTMSESAVAFPVLRRRVVVGQDQPVRAARTGVESLEPAGHPVRREPGQERVGIDEGGEHAPDWGRDHAGGAVAPRHRAGTPVRSRCLHPGQQHGRRWPSSSSSWVRRMRRSRVVVCLASSTQQMNSLRANGVMSFQAASAVAFAISAVAQVRG